MSTASSAGVPAQERHGRVRTGLEEATKMVKRAGTPLLWRKAERVGVV